MHSRIFLVRHGATVLTAEDRFAGATDVELSDEGREQVRRLAAGSRGKRSRRFTHRRWDGPLRPRKSSRSRMNSTCKPAMGFAKFRMVAGNR